MSNEELLPVASDLPAIVAASREGVLLLTAPPGSGKTTLVPSAVLDDLGAAHGKVVLVQPRRAAARAVARRIAHLRGVALGTEVGYHVRFDACYGRDTRLLVVTTGILLRRLLADVTLEGVAAVVLDEFHERTLEVDLALGMLRRLRHDLRPDLRLLLLSATIDAPQLAAKMGVCSVHHVPGRLFPVEIKYPRQKNTQSLYTRVEEVMPFALASSPGDVLVFLPGVGEIVRCREHLLRHVGREVGEVAMLYGDLPAAEQDRVLSPSSQRRIILATNVAETSLTIEGVTCVVDSGKARQMRVHPGTGLPRLELVSISRASADQRAGRAGRLAPGVCWRLWDPTSHAARPAHEPPEIQRTDLSEAILLLLASGLGEVREFPWLDAPPEDAVQAAFRLLECLDAIQSAGQLTPLGTALARLPAHPRLGCLLLEGARRGILEPASLAAALLSERDPFRIPPGARPRLEAASASSTRSDLVDRVERMFAWCASPRAEGHDAVDRGAASAVMRTAEQFRRLLSTDESHESAERGDWQTDLRRALLAAFPDRLCKSRGEDPNRGVMVGGKGVRLDPQSVVKREPLYLALDVQAASGDAQVRLASAIERGWLPESSLRCEDAVFFNPTRQQVEARRRIYWLDLLLEETPIAVDDPVQAAEALAAAALSHLATILPAADSPAGRFRSRVQWLAGRMSELELPSLEDADLREIVVAACQSRTSLRALRELDWLPRFQERVGFDRLHEVDRLAPDGLVVPSGNRIRLEYDPAGPPTLSVRIQEVFGWAETPRLGDGRFPVRLVLLGPNHRPQQITEDLASFWANTYAHVRKELRRRYPKHHWPEDPTQATATRSGLGRQA